MFITNNPTSFHLWLKEGLAKHQNVSNYYDYDWSYHTFILYDMENIFLVSHVLQLFHSTKG